MPASRMPRRSSPRCRRRPGWPTAGCSGPAMTPSTGGRYQVPPRRPDWPVATAGRARAALSAGWVQGGCWTRPIADGRQILVTGLAADPSGPGNDGCRLPGRRPGPGRLRAGRRFRGRPGCRRGVRRSWASRCDALIIAADQYQAPELAMLSRAGTGQYHPYRIQ